MPGLRHPAGPTIPSYGSPYSFLQADVQTTSTQEQLPTWDQGAAAAAMPSFVPNPHKACRPAHFHADWIQGQGHGAAAASKLAAGKHHHNARLKFRSESSPDPKHCNDYDDDLAFMVNDFLESSSTSPLQFDGNDSDVSGPPSIAKICSTLQGLTSSYGGIEGELLNAVWKLILSIDVDADLICSSDGTDCRGGCIKRLVVDQLRAAGYDAAVCKSKWEGSGRVTLQGTVQMGEYEYIDVKVLESVERLIVDIDFQDQFVLARATPNHLSALQLLPTVFVGTAHRLEQILQIMSESVKLSLKQNSMSLPPWRTLNFYHSKWLSAHERIATNTSTTSSKAMRTSRRPHHHHHHSSSSSSSMLPSMPETRQCDVQLRRVQDSLLSDVNSSSTLHVLAGWGGSSSRGNRSTSTTFP